jgi:anti-sigma B factor antagonist
MQHSISTSGDGAVIALSGTFTFDDHESARALMRQFCEGESRRVVYDLSGVTSIDSSGIGLLLMTNDRLNKASKSFALRGPTGLTERALQLARVGDLIPIEA